MRLVEIRETYRLEMSSDWRRPHPPPFVSCSRRFSGKASEWLLCSVIALLAPSIHYISSLAWIVETCRLSKPPRVHHLDEEMNF